MTFECRIGDAPFGVCNATSVTDALPDGGFFTLVAADRPGSRRSTRSRRNREFTLAATILLAALYPARPANAQDAFSAQNLVPAAAREQAYIEGQQATVGYAGAWYGGLFVHYADDPLVLARGDERLGSVVAHQLTADGLLSYAPTDWLALGLGIPVHLSQSGDDLSALGVPGEAEPGGGLGDVRVSAIAVPLRVGAGDGGVAFGVHGLVSLPTGSEEAWQGNGFAGQLGFLLDGVWSRGHRLGLNLDYRVGRTADLGNISLNVALATTVGAVIIVDEAGDWVLVPEVQADIAIGAGGIEDVNSPVEALGAVRFLGVEHLLVELGGGIGLIGGVGSPDWRVFLSIGGRSAPPAEAPVVEPAPAPAPTHCAAGPEDLDGFEDDDDCVDPDNDRDGILDADDACPDVPEDTDPFEPSDGCPEPDNDGDGILDEDDACPGTTEADLEASREVFNDYRDTDGCADEVAFVVTCEAIEIDDRVYFEIDSDVIQARSYSLLDSVADVIIGLPQITLVRIEGHTDSVGSAAHNLDLSRRRAASVVRYLTERGVAAERLSSEGFGEDRAIDTNDTDEGRANNRRVEFRIIERTDCP